MFDFLFKSLNQKKIEEYTRYVEKTRSIEKEYEKLTIPEIQLKIQEHRKSFEGLSKEEKNKLLDKIKEDVFALVSRCSCLMADSKPFKLTTGDIVDWQLRPYDVQLIGGFAINDGNIAEMKTGEGKTLTAAFPAVLNALSGDSVHVVTVNDYLARRDATEMGLLYYMLGLSTGVIVQNQTMEQKKVEYKKDIIYATNNQLGFDYLRDNMVSRLEDKMMGPLSFAIIDEVDSILIDEARTPLVISQPLAESIDMYKKYDKVVHDLVEQKENSNEGDFKIFAKEKNAILTNQGIKKIEERLGVNSLYKNNGRDVYFIEKALLANYLFKKDIDYIVDNGEILIVDEHTGRVLSGRRYSNGIHQALEAKENVEIRNESKTLANITYQNYFRAYEKISGMTGTAKTEEDEFYQIYGLDVIVIPTNKPLIRKDHPDLLFKNNKGKMQYLLNLIKEYHSTGRPVLVGTGSVEQSEIISKMLVDDNSGLQHYVLNAKRHKEEAEVISKAGEKGAITIATNMAGRGTDIKLTDEVKELGGLVIIGTEKHETRRIDNQLRGRSGRQGDAGDTFFLISPEDHIMKIFGGDKLYNLFNGGFFAAYPEDQPLVNTKMLTKKIDGIQKQVEGSNFDIRKQILQYDDVFNVQRKIFYEKRDNILKITELSDVTELLDKVYTKFLYEKLLITIESTESDEMSMEILKKFFNEYSFHNIDLSNINIKSSTLYDDLVKNKIIEKELSKYLDLFIEKEDYIQIIKDLLLGVMDELWIEHMQKLEEIKTDIAFVGQIQRDPLSEYKNRGFIEFGKLMDDISFRFINTYNDYLNNYNDNIKKVETI